MTELILKKIKINNLIKLEKKEAYFDIYIKVGERYIQFSKKEYNNYDSLVKLKLKFEEVYLTEESYDKYIIQKETDFKKFELKDIKEKQRVIEELQKDQKILKSVLSDSGVLDKEKIKQIEFIKNKNLNFVKNLDSIKSLFDLYEKNNNHSIIKKQMESYILTSILTNSKKLTPEVVDNFITGFILSDILLNEEEYWISHGSNNYRNMDSKIKNHGVNLLKILPEDLLKPYVINFIKDHHEKPDGTGYPNKIKCDHFNFFTALYVIVEDYVSQLLTSKCQSNKYEEIIENISDKYKVYLNTPFESALSCFLKNISESKVNMKGGFSEQKRIA